MQDGDRHASPDGETDPLDALVWDNRSTAALPADPSSALGVRQVHGAAFSRVAPTPTAAPRLLAWSRELGEQLGIEEDAAWSSPALAASLGGSRVPRGADPHAMAYAGHQFGGWAGQLGDGRAIVLGEVRDRDGQLQALQLKGAGPTPYSRGADGRAVLRSSLREFLCSEAMHALGIPTTRALSLVATGDEVVRDVLYSGDPAPEPGAVVCRVAPSLLRFGSFELPASRGDRALLAALIEHALAEHFPDADGAVGMFEQVCARTAHLVADWMRVGFVHGVLNTDNMSLLGLTIDYGPYGWLEPWDPGWTPNTTDAQGRRYRFGAQPQVVQWNLLQLANALLLHTGEAAPLEAALDAFAAQYEARSRELTAARLGWGAWRSGDESLVDALHGLLARVETDYVLVHRELGRVSVREHAPEHELLAPLLGAFYRDADVEPGTQLHADWVRWLRAWGARVRGGGIVDDAARRAAMDALNPRFVPRNWLAQTAIEAAEAGDMSVAHELQRALLRPYDEQPELAHLALRRPEWAREKVGSSQLSCSS